MTTTTNLLLCIVLLQAFVVIQETESTRVIETKPAEIKLGMTTSLEVNCSFVVDGTANLAALISLLISRSNDSGQTFTEVASLTEFTPTIVNVVIPTENIQAMGIVNQGGESYIHLRLEYPMAHQGGLYQCSSQGIDNIGHSIIMTNSTNVLVNEANALEFAEKMQKMENYTKQLENTIVSERDQCANSLQGMMSEINNLNRSLEQARLIVDFFTKIPWTFGNSKYYLCTDGASNIQNSTDMCQRIGGYLIVINTAAEYQALLGYLSTTTGFQFVATAGSDAAMEGTWMVQSTHQDLPYTSWQPGFPKNTTDYNCLLLNGYSQWQMIDDICNWGSPALPDIRYICEVTTA